MGRSGGTKLSSDILNQVGTQSSASDLRPLHLRPLHRWPLHQMCCWCQCALHQMPVWLAAVRLYPQTSLRCHPRIATPSTMPLKCNACYRTSYVSSGPSILTSWLAASHRACPTRVPHVLPTQIAGIAVLHAVLPVLSGGAHRPHLVRPHPRVCGPPAHHRTAAGTAVLPAVLCC